MNLKKNKKIFVKKLSFRSKDSGSSEVGEEWVESDSNDDLDIDISEEDEEEEEHQNINANVGDFLLVEVCGKKKGNINHYVAEIMKVEEIGYEVKYMKRLSLSYSFVFEKEDLYLVLPTDIVKRLPKPSVFAGTERTLQNLSFQTNLTKYNVH